MPYSGLFDEFSTSTGDTGTGNDDVEGGFGSDLVIGGAGDDILLGGRGDDVLQGGAGEDRLTGHDGKDELSGGSGSDLFVVQFSISDGLQNHPNTYSPEANDLLRDFVSGQDELRITYFQEIGGGYPNFSRIVTLAEMDSNGDGALNDGDDGFDLASVTLDGQKTSLVIDTAKHAASV